MVRAAQLNVRMSPQLKAAGDSVLELYGISPTELIRALWQKVSLGGEALEQVILALAAVPSAGSTRAQSDGRNLGSLANTVLQRQMDFEREVGLDPSTYTPLDNDQLEELVYLDWLEERQDLHDL
ncbi:MAG: hypothetical protein Q4A01_08065 [Coriobacteriales bacterium]|nr:hypothetical protein [Coriobacteriales bacterium]